MDADSPAAKNQPSWKHPTTRRYVTQRLTCADLLEGQSRIHAECDTYLPKLPREKPAGYSLRVADSVLTNFYRTIIRAGRGIVFTIPPTIAVNAPDWWKLWWDDVTSDGTRGAVFYKAVLGLMLSEGYCGVLADFPNVGGSLTYGQERRGKVMPYLSLYTADQIVNFAFIREGGRQMLSLLVLREEVLESEGLFGFGEVCQYRVFRRIVRTRSDGLRQVFIIAQLYRKADGAPEKNEWVQYGAPYLVRGVTEIPFVEFSADRENGPFAARPTLIEVADLNLAHFRTTSHRRWAMTATCYPLPVRIGYRAPEGEEGAETEAGPTSIMDLPGNVAGADFKYAAPPDGAFAPTEKELQKLESHIGFIGLGFLTGSSNFQFDETATAKKLNQRGHDATLADCAQNLEDGMNEVAFYVGQFKGDAYVEPIFSVNRDFQRKPFDAQMATALSTLETSDQITLKTMLSTLKLGHLPDDFNEEDEIADVETQMVTKLDRKVDEMVTVNDALPPEPTPAA